MAIYRMTIDSSWTLPDLFDYMARYSNTADWDPWTTSGEELTAGDPKLHSEYQLSMAIGRREIPLVYQIVEFDRLRRVVLSAEYKMIRSLAAIEVTPSPGGTRLTYESAITGLGPFAAADPLIARALRRSGATAETNLRTKLDA
jgi:dehydrogenase/reductase SDR family protein 12